MVMQSLSDFHLLLAQAATSTGELLYRACPHSFSSTLSQELRRTQTRQGLLTPCSSILPSLLRIALDKEPLQAAESLHFEAVMTLEYRCQTTTQEH